jgi:serine/threonine-protein kinase HipA
LHVARGHWRLAPAFDINPFPERLRELKTWISQDTGPEATIEALMSVLPYFRIPPERAKAILAEVDAAIATWRSEGVKLGMTRYELDEFTDAFEHPERAAVLLALG